MKFLVGIIIFVCTQASLAASVYSGSSSLSNFAGYFSANPYAPKTFELDITGVPSASISSGLFTIEVLGDFSESNEYIGVNIEGYDLGRFLNNNASDDLFNNASFNDVGNDYVSPLTANANIPIATLNAIISDGVITITIDPSLGVQNYVFAGRPEEYVNVSLSYEIETAPIPLPPAIWLLGSGLMGLVITSQKKQKDLA